MSKPEKNKEKELIEEIYKLIKAHVEPEQEERSSETDGFQSFISYLKGPEGRHLVRLLSFIISLGVTRIKEDDYTVNKIWNYIDSDLRIL